MLGVKAFNDFDARQCEKSFEIEMLPQELVWVWWISLDGGSEELDRNNFNIVSNQTVGEFLKIKLLVRCAFQHSVEKIEPIYIYVYLHGFGNAKAGLSPGLAPPQQCLGGWLERIVPNIFLGAMGCGGEIG